MVVKKKKTNFRKPRTRGAESMTESQFWSMIRASLRKSSQYWKPISVCRNKARRKYEGPKKKQKFEYLCNNCHKWFPLTTITVDHIVPVGTLSSFEDLPGFVQRLFCETDGLQCLCEECHKQKTLNERFKQE
jgi:5-methylcytosine-specific restriction endonuclease McrA